MIFNAGQQINRVKGQRPIDMEAYQFECANAEIEELARVISDLFPEQTQFIERAGENGVPQIVVHWVAMRFGSTAKRMELTVAIAPAALARYRAMPPRARAAASRYCAPMWKRRWDRSKKSTRKARPYRAK
ncbi:hypothetical protein PPGU19_016090 [Paraburkholderia sp. PGU19]|nr:hypothetical protein PPGU19_016090 [Paraburkholderia sp. PGU19]